MTSSASIHPACQARIDTAALRHNYAVLKQRADGAKVLALLKANAYGHGLISVAQALPEADAFGVARLSEAVQLRDAGISNRIVILGGVQHPEEWLLVDRLSFDVVIHQDEQLQACQDFCSGLDDDQLCGFNIWLKFDTGMNRLGFPLTAINRVKNSLEQITQHFSSPIVLMSHFAHSDDQDDPMNQAQMSAFKSIRKTFQSEAASPYEFTLSNSGALLSENSAHADWVRPGIALFGIAPYVGQKGGAFSLKPVMTLTSRLIAVRELEPGEGVGYGQLWRADSAVRIGIASIGYGDGYPWQAKNGTPVMVEGHACQLAGRVSMDLLAIDLSNAPEAHVGSGVQLWGDQLPVETVAECSETIPYTLVCGITQRVSVEVI